MAKLLFYITFTCSLGAGLLAGVFFAFSVFVMQSLTKLPAEQGITAMQNINTTILQSSFMVVFTGTTVVSVVLGIASFIKLSQISALYVIAGSLLIFVGVFLVTTLVNVPLNDTLAAVTSGSTEGAQAWKEYLDRWMPWNHVRTIASIGALIFFIIAIRKWEF